MAARTEGASESDVRSRIDAALAHAAHLLPAQAPIEVFVHHNTLHAFQALPFHEAVAKAGERFGARGYLTEDEYREALAQGRISEAELAEAIDAYAPGSGAASAPTEATPVAAGAQASTAGTAQNPGWPPTKALLLAVLRHGVEPIEASALAWRIAEEGLLDRFAPEVPKSLSARMVEETRRWLGEHAKQGGSFEAAVKARFGAPAELEPELARLSGRALERALARWGERLAVRALWAGCVALGRRPSVPARAARRSGPSFVRDALYLASHEDPAERVHAALIPICGAFLDRGQATWPMPGREDGLFAVWLRLGRSRAIVRPQWCEPFLPRLSEWAARGVDAHQAVAELLELLGVPAAGWSGFIEEVLLQLPGWAGMFARLERASPGGAKVRLVDLLAVRLLLDVASWTDAAARLGYDGPVRGLLAAAASMPALAEDTAAAIRAEVSMSAPPLDARARSDAFRLFRLAQLCGLAAPELAAVGEGAGAVLQQLDAFDPPTRLRVWHEAYERHHRDELLEGIAAVPGAPARPPAIQLAVCIDDRQESLRRHFEELSPSHQTFGTAGFFNLAIAYQGLDDTTTFPLCPVVVQPRHRIEEQVEADDAHLAAARARRRKRWGRLSAAFDRLSRSLVSGALVSVASGAASALPLLGNVFLPRAAARLRQGLFAAWLPTPKTRLPAPRIEAGEGGLFEGFTVDELADRVGTLLEGIGLVHGFAPIVAIVGHESSSVNNPHFAAYACGACGGRSGGPNARLFAAAANLAEVRVRLSRRGIAIPESTLFVGGAHDTAKDAVRWFDLDLAPTSARAGLEALDVAIREACRRNAQERCRRFDTAPARASPAEALAHVEERSFDLSQARPELGHATNASSIVGRRALSYGLFLDRRCFLVSYDPTIDADGRILERTLLAAAPVCAGINLEYFFSRVDNERYGAGTKLPHNVAGLVGVMNGTCSDLRTGLPKQMIEIHEPIRLQLVIETRPEVLAAILARQPGLDELVRNGWMTVVTADPQTRAFHLYADGRFVPWQAHGEQLEVVRSSAEWFLGHADFLRPALIIPEVARA